MIWMSVWRALTLENAATEIDLKTLTWCSVELFQATLIIVNNSSGDSFPRTQNCTVLCVVCVCVWCEIHQNRNKIQGFMSQNYPLHITNIISKCFRAALFKKGNQSQTVQCTAQSDSARNPLTDDRDACCHKQTCTERNANNINVSTCDELITNPMNTNTCKECAG